MKLHRYPIAFLGFFLIGINTSSADALDVCNTIVVSGLKSISIDKESNSHLNVVFDEHCQSNGSAKDRSLNIGLEAAIKKIPFKFSLGSSRKKETVQNFCKTHHSTLEMNNTRSKYEETLVTRAYDSIDRCIEMAVSDITLNHTYSTKSNMSFFVKPGQFRPVRIKGISVDGEIECRGIDPTKKNGKEEIFGGSTSILLSGQDTLNFVCVRKDGDRAGGVVTLLTDVTDNGNYTAFMPTIADTDPIVPDPTPTIFAHIASGQPFVFQVIPNAADTECIDGQAYIWGNLLSGSLYRTHYNPGSHAWITTGPNQGLEGCPHYTNDKDAINHPEFHSMVFDSVDPRIKLWGGVHILDEKGGIYDSSGKNYLGRIIDP